MNHTGVKRRKLKAKKKNNKTRKLMQYNIFPRVKVGCEVPDVEQTHTHTYTHIHTHTHTQSRRRQLCGMCLSPLVSKSQEGKRK